ncbi:MAG TPA: hypothetical protein VFS12_03620 [Terriglobia bacterium]|nr:hypothetical protein [Terriglobia bacterium]
MKTGLLAILLILIPFTSFPAYAQGTPTPADSASIKSFSKFDFVPGEKVVAFEDFMDGEIGDFPARWNTNAAGEIVTIEGKPGRWLKFTRAGVFSPELTPTLPDNFTLEFDLLTSTPFSGTSIRINVDDRSTGTTELSYCRSILLHR